MTILGFIIAYKIRPFTDLIPFAQFKANLATFPTWNEYLELTSYTAILLIIVFGIRRMYSLHITYKISKELKQVFLSTLIWLMLIIAYYFITRSFPFSRLVLAYSWLFTLILVSLGRIIIKWLQVLLLKLGIGQRKVLFIGSNIITQKIFQSLLKNPSYKIIGTLDHQNTRLKKGPKIIGSFTDLQKIIHRYKVEEIIQTKSDLIETQNEKILNFCRQNHLQYHFVPDLIEVQRTNIDIATLSGIPLISLKPTPLDGWGKVIKRIFDIVISSAALIILIPLFVIIAVLIKLDSKGPVFFNRLDDDSPAKRAGQFGKLFKFVKFRTMKPKTHSLRYTTLSAQDTRQDGPMVKIKNDPRITRFGKFLRKTSLDELPQLWHVLTGKMSFVGPRPHLPEEVAKYKDYQKFVLTIKPGITGLAQISGRSDLNFDEEVALDTYYIENWSPLLDLKIILKTFFVMFKKYEE